MFGEKEYENYKGNKLPVWQTPKYLASKDKAIELLNKGDFGLVEGDFWILMNTYANEAKMQYTGLILSHNGCLKINDKLDDPFKAQFLTREWIGESLIYEYNDGTLYEVGEVSPANLKKNGYPYAMAFKRCFDRVVLKKSKLAYSGIYSEVEADEFKQKIDDNAESSLVLIEPTINKNQMARVKAMFPEEELKTLGKQLGLKKLSDMPVEVFQRLEKEYEESHKELLQEPINGIWG